MGHGSGLSYYWESENRSEQSDKLCVCFIPPGRANHWSAIIGASHSRNYVLWEYGGYASDGVKQVAELGSPVKMEEEIRQKVRDNLKNLKKYCSIHTRRVKI